MRLTTAAEFLERVKAHNQETGHEIIAAVDPIERLLGYACAECLDPTGTEWSQTVWELSLVDLRQTSADVSARLAEAGLTAAQFNTAVMLDWMNEHTLDRFFGHSGTEPDDIIPLARMEPEADDLAWAHQHINTPLQPREDDPLAEALEILDAER